MIKRAYCWGANNVGQLGSGSTSQSVSTPTEVALPAQVAVSVISAGLDHACLVTSTFVPMCWGGNAAGQLGINSTTASSQPVGVFNFTAAGIISAGESFSCATLQSTKQLYCWGLNTYGQLGVNNLVSYSVPTKVQSTMSWTEVVCGQSMTCGVAADSTYCWGRNDAGQLGFNSLGANRLMPVLVFGGEYMNRVSAWGRTGCAIKNGTIPVCWGMGSMGQLGNGANPLVTLSPVVVNLPGGKAVAITSSGDHSCATVPDTNQLYCWGSNQAGSLGIGSAAASFNTPEAVDFQPTIMASKNLNTLAAAPESGPLPQVGLVAWGSNTYGQLGQGTYNPPYLNRPAAVRGLWQAYAVSAGSYYSCALVDEEFLHSIFCWGLNNYGQLGIGTANNEFVRTPTRVANGYRYVSAGFRHTCAISSSTDAAYCWGENLSGQIGDGTTTMRTVPTKVTGLAAALTISAGRTHTCAVTSGSLAAYCWGANDYGQLGQGNLIPSSLPIRVTTRLWDEIVAGSYQSCGAVDGGISCWGLNNQGQSGTGLTSQTLTQPTLVVGSTGWRGVSAFGPTACAINSNSKVVCWGRGTEGQIGNGSSNNTSTPLLVDLGTEAVQVSSGGDHVCARTHNDDVYCWGENEYGAIGIATYVSTYNAPRQVGILARDISANYDNTLAV
ncbi:hypothetical protein H632_c76p0 [Helicosporidium sp. ATCC 50920]|nr:hypothetical protein H632_c76p0 [Helicosporidium sp. ATCC 50920]|eukprot:KDD76887.1 hypothetical protein H632_c76p0 [Helicosporidium sp. ATCC 50920]